jgi:hypothetical protein
MRKVLISVALCLLMSGVISMNGGASSTTHFVGYITDTDTGYPAEYSEVSFKNLRTNEIANATTNATGYYDFDLDSFEDGWQDGDPVMIMPASSGTNTAYHPVILVEVGICKQYDMGRDSNQNRYISLAQSLWVDSRTEIASNGNVHDKMYDNDIIYLPLGYDTYIEIWDGFGYYENGIGFPRSGNYNVKLTFLLQVTYNDPPVAPVGIGLTYCTIQYTAYNGIPRFWYDPALSVSVSKNWDQKPLDILGSVRCDLYDSANNWLEQYSWFASSTISGVRYDWR